MDSDMINFIDENCEDFVVIRNSVKSHEIRAFFANENKIQTMPNIDVQEDDWLLQKSSGKKFFIDDVRPIMEGSINYGYILKYLSENKYNREKQTNSPSISIGTINGGAIIGNQESATINNGYNIEEIRKLISKAPLEEQEELNKMLDVVQTFIENEVPLNKGVLSKFSDLLAKHKEIAIFLGNSILGFLTQK
ncbi:hypothetical protein [uncultured Rummeliibacillus sp.]|uniref:hypothetical protein n=1 Tax=uncultured Rummeliibacillus sp. TaxID=762292 RepID=UPI0026154CD3|nr:hypothetical protein [uncultured Rummeliibacillus sp.]